MTEENRFLLDTHYLSVTTLLRGQERITWGNQEEPPARFFHSSPIASIQMHIMKKKFSSDAEYNPVFPRPSMKHIMALYVIFSLPKPREKVLLSEIEALLETGRNTDRHQKTLCADYLYILFQRFTQKIIHEDFSKQETHEDFKYFLQHAVQYIEENSFPEFLKITVRWKCFSLLRTIAEHFQEKEPKVSSGMVGKYLDILKSIYGDAFERFLAENFDCATGRPHDELPSGTTLSKPYLIVVKTILYRKVLNTIAVKQVLHFYRLQKNPEQAVYILLSLVQNKESSVDAYADILNQPSSFPTTPFYKLCALLEAKETKAPSTSNDLPLAKQPGIPTKPSHPSVGKKPSLPATAPYSPALNTPCLSLRTSPRTAGQPSETIGVLNHKHKKQDGPTYPHHFP